MGIQRHSGVSRIYSSYISSSPSCSQPSKRYRILLCLFHFWGDFPRILARYFSALIVLLDRIRPSHTGIAIARDQVLFKITTEDGRMSRRVSTDMTEKTGHTLQSLQV